MSLQADILRTEIEKLKHEKMTDRTAQLLSVYWGALQAVQDAPSVRSEQPEAVQVANVSAEPLEPVQSATGAWRSVVHGKDMQAVADVMDRHFEVISAVAPKHYAAVLAALDKI